MPSIVGRFLNWWLNPYWTYMFIESQMGQIINVYAYIAFFVVILTYGMETGYFRFASREKDSKTVFSTSFISLIFTTVSFLLLVITFKGNIANFLEISANPEYLVIMAITLSFDVISTIPFAKLRFTQRPVKFAFLKFINIGVNIFFNLFFLSGLPWLAEKFPTSFINLIYHPDFGIGYVFVANLIASTITFLLLIPEFRMKLNFSASLLKRMVLYSFPILIVGITGMINMQIDKILLPRLLPAEAEPLKQLGIYGSNFKLAVLLNMFIQAFRFAFEPFFFNQKEDGDSKKMYALILKYFTLFGLLIFVGLSTFVDILKLLIAPEYRVGVGIVPIVLLANFFMGVYFTLSLWYKLSDKTRYGAYMGIIGSVITLTINIALIPLMGYYASALAILICFIVMTTISFVWGHKFYPIPYDIKSFIFYLFVSVILVSVYWIIRTDEAPVFWLSVLINLIFMGIIFLREKREFKTLFTK